MASRDDDVLYRRQNLTFALLHARRPRSRDWIRRHVDGYQNASEKTLQRDLRYLRSIGVPVTITHDDVGISAEHYELPPVTFTPAEATVIGLAGELGRAGEIGAFARSGWTKLAAGGARRDLSTPQMATHTSYNDTTRLSPGFLTRVLAAVDKQRRIRFQYRPSPAAASQTREMDVWGLVPHDGRVYLVGHDLDRDEPRCFRAVRVSGVEEAGPAEHPPVDDLRAVVRQSLDARRESVDAVLSAPEDYAGELGEARDGVISLKNVDADWLVRTAAAYAPEVVVKEPAEIRQRVVALLEEVAGE
ncbi:WYL domain-containing protein [Corynebacterium yudongzhengii]|uniref:WYL domain-containing protein n=1 Tax=Corynebacterium yudongzhengii TaxID=2080740 RepID=A0A2U1T8H0_9CORY|nr:WYL domain-containing protein [Corynebacterium yudongzhengii]AWB81904.1 WYL domain-containing protein [Corynebacterium yudongzhengii]PWC02296.1 WYL domain-containing protein [Corynebacterium yudongzhengii]